MLLTARHRWDSSFKVAVLSEGNDADMGPASSLYAWILLDHFEDFITVFWYFNIVRAIDTSLQIW